MSLQAGSSWVQSNMSPCSQVPKYCPGLGADPRPTKARFLQMSAPVSRRVGAAVSPTPPPKCGAQALLGGGSKHLPNSCICSVTRPELPGPLSCWPGSCLLLTQWPPLAPRLQASRPGVAGHSLSCLQSPAIADAEDSDITELLLGLFLLRHLQFFSAFLGVDFAAFRRS